VATNYAYDNLSRLQSVLHQLAGSTIDGATYTVDNAGNRTAKTDQLAGVTSNYGYDAIYELTGVTQGTNTTESYTYDPVGNRLSSLGVSPYSVNSSNQLTSTPATNYTYDYNGSTLTSTSGSNTTSYVWDFENRLTSVTLPGSGGTVSFKYDSFGRRIQKSFTTGANPPTTTIINYIYDGDNGIEEVDPNGSVLARYSQGLNIDEPLAMLRGSTSYYQADGLGSVTSLSNAAGALAQTYTFDSFGKQTAASGSLTNPFRYTGRESDVETGLYYYRTRYYDQNAGRFLNEDPVGFNGGGSNFYRYVNENPLTLVDPFGLAPGCRNCSIFVKCRGVQYKHLGRSGFRHCDARVVGSDGVEHSLTAGPTGDPLNSDLNAWDIPNPPDAFTGHTVYKKDPADCNEADCLIKKTDDINGQPNKPKYHAFFGPNSDTMLKDIFRSCGIKLHIRWYGSPILNFWPLP